MGNVPPWGPCPLRTLQQILAHGAGHISDWQSRCTDGGGGCLRSLSALSAPWLGSVSHASTRASGTCYIITTMFHLARLSTPPPPSTRPCNIPPAVWFNMFAQWAIPFMIPLDCSILNFTSITIAYIVSPASVSWLLASQKAIAGNESLWLHIVWHNSCALRHSISSRQCYLQSLVYYGLYLIVKCMLNGTLYRVREHSILGHTSLPHIFYINIQLIYSPINPLKRDNMDRMTAWVAFKPCVYLWAKAKDISFQAKGKNRFFCSSFSFLKISLTLYRVVHSAKAVFLCSPISHATHLWYNLSSGMMVPLLMVQHISSVPLDIRSLWDSDL